MKYKEKLSQLISERKTVICIGLDSDIEKIPEHLKKLDNPILEFNRQIIEATSDIVISYKPNVAFYEGLGSVGWEILKKTIELIPENVPVIVDAKRGDIGNTSAMYAKAIFDDLGGDAVTLSPYLGEDSLAPFMEYKDKFSFILCVTSNAGAQDFQFLESNGSPLYHHVAEAVLKWNKNDNLGLVVGAPYPQKIKELRAVSGNLPFLIPGVGAQGGDLEAAVRFGSDEGTSLVVVNNARAVLYASDGVDFAEKAREEVQKLNQIVTDLGIY
jgi:orotidine-5'-phosphate decarboxylase